jgi:hypothetical protein
LVTGEAPPLPSPVGMSVSLHADGMDGH